MKKISTLLTVALLTASIGGAFSALAADSTSNQSTSVTSSTTPFAVVHDQSAYFPTGQGTVNFDYKAPASGTEKVQVFVQNNSAKTINVKMVSPSGTAWISGFTIAPGKSLISEHYFGASQQGFWLVYFDTNDGSPISVDVRVKDGL